MEQSKEGRLYIVAGPIGNLEDVTFRAIRLLKEADAVACEDTRITRRLLDRYGIKPGRIISYHEHNEERAGAEIVALLEEGSSCALLTDAGFPGISDPGYRIVNACLEEDLGVEVLPGPSAVLTALVASGLPSSSFTFKGFPPRKSGERKRFLEADSGLPHTLVFFESPHRIGSFLKDALSVLGDRKAAVCIELTKKFERVKRAYLSELVEAYGDKPERGEITVVISGNNRKFIRE